MNDLAVLIPAYRANDTIVRCLCSLRAQTFQAFDVILLVDGVDLEFPHKECGVIIQGTEKWEHIDEIIQDDISWMRPVAPRATRRLWQGCTGNHRGIARARNDLLAYASTSGYKYVAWQDADDESEPERLRLQREYLKAHPDIFQVGTWITEIEANGKERGIETPTDPAKIREGYYGGQQAVSGATAMFRLHSPWRDEHGAPVGGIRFREDLPIGEDTVFNLEIQKRWPLCQANIGQRLYRYHRQPGGGAVRRYRALAAAGQAVPIGQFMKDCVEKYG